MNSWKTMPLAEACDKITDGTHHSPPIQPVGIPYVTAKHIKADGLDFFSDPWFVSENDHRAIFSRCDPRPGDVLYIKDGATTGIAAVNRYTFEFSMLSSVALLRPRAAVLTPEFLCHWLNAPLIKHRILGGMAGAAIRRLTLGKINAIRIPLPPLPEQRRIAAILDKADELRAKRRAALAKLDSLTQAIFLDMFGDPAIDLNGVTTKRLGDYLVFLTSGGRGWAKFYTSTGSRFIRSLDVQMNHIGNKEVAYVTAPDNAEARRTRVRKGDVLLTITGSRIGRVAPVPAELEGSFVSQHVAILRVDAEQIDSRFLSFFLSLETGGQRQIAKAQYGQTKPGLNFEQIQRFEIPVPAVEQQCEFGSRMAALEKLKTSQSTSLEDLDALFASLQNRAFQGEL